MPIVTTRSIVLRTYPYSDTSKILRLMTRDHGPRSAIARGARRPRSRFGGLIEPFAEGSATLYLKENRELHTLSDFDQTRDRQALGRDLLRFAGGSLICEMVMRLAPEHRDDRLFSVLAGGLDDLADALPAETEGTVLRVGWNLVSALGFAPDLSACLTCGRAIPEGDRAGFDFTGGGLRCSVCSGGGAVLESRELRLLRTLANGGPAGRAPPDGRRLSPAAGRRQRRLLAHFIRHHLAEGLRLRSLPFLETVER